MRATILQELSKIEKAHHVRILYAVESGSRAWGFASPDSDYDVRFIYVRPITEYIRLDTPRDVIEWQLDEVLDINGWDIRKALWQLFKGNAVLHEWLNSPIIYKEAAEWAAIKAVSRDYFSEKAALYHYYGLARNTEKEHLGGENVRYKKYFYALRPLLAARYIAEKHIAPPVLFSELLKMPLAEPLRLAINDLLEKKKVTTESEFNPQIPVIIDFIRAELERQKAISIDLTADNKKDISALNRCLAEVIR
jgi:predicted nucleotidyltransferase